MRHEHAILVVEDDPYTRTAVAGLLRENGFKTWREPNGTTALRRLRGRRKPCVILLDLMMPGITGWEFLERHRANRSLSKVPLVLMTGWTDTDLAQARAMVTKPIDPARLLRSLRRVLASSPCGGNRPRRGSGRVKRRGNRRAA
ncbi:MAG TPA: response regulator [Thermoanaerobaculia bacterium]|nr:response regulator [Thermoanaerobaculia bacterium]